MEANEPKPTPEEPTDADRKEAATSSATLADLEETQKSSPDATADTPTVPAPDGTPDPDRGSATDSRTSGDPM